MTAEMETILKAILDDDRAKVKSLLKAKPRLAADVLIEPRLYQSRIVHWLYAGDTILHLAAAGHRPEIVRTLLEAEADPNARKNHRRSGPLHYAADSCINGPDWNPSNQVRTIELLIEAGAEIEAADKNGATALHRAVRTRSAAAVSCLLHRGSDPGARNKPGSTPFHLAVQNTGKSGSGGAEAKEAQKEIIRRFISLGVSPEILDANGKSVRDCARSDWIRDLLT